jgi:hypothetical protein
MRNRKSQAAVPIILLTMLGLILFYILWVAPEERERLLPNVTEEEEIPGEVAREVGNFTIGMLVGKIGKGHLFENITLSYPSEQKSIMIKTFTLSSNILSSGVQVMKISIPDLENTKEIRLKFKLLEKVGSPRVKVEFEEETLFDKEIEVGELKEIRIGEEDLQAENEVRFVCQFSGWMFWQTQVCELNVEILHLYYRPLIKIEKRSFTLASEELHGNILKVSFEVGEAKTEGDLWIEINEQPIYVGKPSEGEYSYAAGIEKLGLKLGKNEVIFKVEKGGVYSLSNVEIAIYSEDFVPGEAIYDFDIPEDVYFGNQTIKIYVRIAEIIRGGRIAIKIYPRGELYEQWANLGWNHFVIERDALELRKNTAKLYAPEGKFLISDFVLTWE